MSHRLLCILLVAAGLVVSACTWQKPAQPVATPPQPGAGASARPSGGGPRVTSPGHDVPAPIPTVPADALALQTAAVAEKQASQLEMLLARSGRLTTQPAGADLLNGASIQLSLGPPQDINSKKLDPGLTDTGPAAANSVATVMPKTIEPTRPAPAPPVPAADPLEKAIAQQLKDSPKELAAQLDYQLYQFLHESQVPQLDVIAPLAAEDRAILSAVMDGLSNFRTNVRTDGNMLAARKVRPLLDMADRLRAAADLRVPVTALCTRVDKFGVYDPIEPARFIAGKEHPVIVYCEVENFASQLNDKKLWETRLTQEAVLYTEAGMMVWEDAENRSRPIIDECRNRRHDFFMVKMIKLPANLSTGRYLLKVTINDQISQRIAETTVGIQIVAQ